MTERVRSNRRALKGQLAIKAEQEWLRKKAARTFSCIRHTYQGLIIMEALRGPLARY